MKKIALWTFIEVRPEFRNMGYGKNLTLRAEQIVFDNGVRKMKGYIDKPNKSLFFQKLSHLPTNKKINYRVCEKTLKKSPKYTIPKEIVEKIEKKYIPLNTNIFPIEYENKDETYKITWFKNEKLVGFTTFKFCKERRKETWPRI